MPNEINGVACQPSSYNSNQTVEVNHFEQMSENNDEKFTDICHYATAIQMNNIASEMYKQNQYDAAMDRLKSAIIYIARFNKEMKSIASELLNTKGPLCRGNNSFTKQMYQLDIYDWPGAACDYGPRFLHETIKIESDSSLQLHHETVDLTSSVAILYNLGLVNLRNGSCGLSLKVFELALKIVPSELICKQLNLSISILAIMNNVGCILCMNGILDKAGEYFKKASKIGKELTANMKKEKTRGKDGRTLQVLTKYASTAMSNAGRVHFVLNEDREAEDWCKKTLNLRQLTFEDRHIDIVVAKYNLGMVYHRIGRLDEALENYLPFTTQGVSPTFSWKEEFCRDIVSALMNRLLIQCNINNFGEYSRRIGCALKRLYKVRSHFINAHPSVVEHLSEVGNLLVEIKEYKAGVSFFQEQHQVEKALLGCNNPELAITLTKIGEVFQNLNNPREALKYYRQASNLEPPHGCFKTSISNRSIFAITNYNIGTIYCNEGKYKQGINILKLAIHTQKSILGENHPEVATLLYNVGVLHFTHNRSLMAMDVFKESLHIRQLVFGNDHFSTIESSFYIARIYDKRGELNEAMNVYNEILCVHKRSGKPSTIVVIVLQKIAQIYYEKEELDRALEFCYDALITLCAIPYNRNIHKALILNMMGNIFAEMKKLDESKEAFLTSNLILQEARMDWSRDLDLLDDMECLIYVDLLENRLDNTAAAAA